MSREKLDFIISQDNTNNDNYTTLKEMEVKGKRKEVKGKMKRGGKGNKGMKKNELIISEKEKKLPKSIEIENKKG